MYYFDEEYYDDLNEYVGSDNDDYDYYPEVDEWPAYSDYIASLEEEENVVQDSSRRNGS